MSKIKCTKENDGVWTVYNRQTGRMATIVKIQEYGFLAPSKARYRVDNDRGVTIDSMIEHFQTAKSVAIKSVKE